MAATAHRAPNHEPRPEDQRRRLRRGLISLAALGAVVIGLLLAVPPLHGVASRLGHMNARLIILAVGLEILS